MTVVLQWTTQIPPPFTAQYRRRFAENVHPDKIPLCHGIVSRRHSFAPLDRNEMNAVRILLLASVVLGLVLLCLNAPPRSEPAPAAFTHVVYWEKWSGYEAQAARAVVDTFNATIGKEQKIFVEYVPVANVDVKAQIAIVGGDPPDVVGLWQRNVSGFAAANALIPLDEIGDTDPVETMTIERLWNACKYHDELFAVPSTPATIALYWNRRLFADSAQALIDAGMDPSQAPRTLEELKRASEILSVRDDKNRLERMGYLPGTAGSFDWYWHTWPTWWGVTWTDPSTDRLDVARFDVVEAHRWVQSYTRDYGFKNVLDFESKLGAFGAPDNPFLTGEVVMVRQGPWMAHLLRRFKPDMDVGVAPFPTRSGEPIGFFEMDVLAIPRGAKNPQAAWTFVDWLYAGEPITISGYRELAPWLDGATLKDALGDTDQSELQLKPIEWLCWLHGKNSPLADLSDAFVKTHPNKGIDVHEFLARQTPAATLPPLPNWSELLSEYRAAYGEVWISDCDVQARFEKCQREIEALTKTCVARYLRWGVTYP